MDVAPFIGFAAAFVLIVFVMHGYVANTPIVHQGTWVLLPLSMLGIFFTTLQLLSVINVLGVPWEEPMRTVVDKAAFLVFDLQSGVIRFSCLASLRPLHAFTARVSAIVIAGLTILLAHLFFRRCKPVDFQHSAPLKNSLGLVFLSFYIGVARATLVPLECYDHVSDGRASIVAFPQVLCGSPEHGQMQAVAAAAIVCFPLAFLAHSATMTRMYPRRIQEGDLRFLEATKYLFHVTEPLQITGTLVRVAAACAQPRHCVDPRVRHWAGVLHGYDLEQSAHLGLGRAGEQKPSRTRSSMR